MTFKKNIVFIPIDQIALGYANRSKKFYFAVRYVLNLLKNAPLWGWHPNGQDWPNKLALASRFHRCLTENSKSLPYAKCLKAYLVCWNQKVISKKSCNSAQ